jgi:peptide/nickel transport system substrate-binding protein
VRPWRALSCVLVSAWLAACAAGGPAPSASVPAAGSDRAPDASAAQVDRDARIVVSQAADADTLHPILISSTQSEAISRLIHEGLTATDPFSRQPIPQLAVSWSNPDDLTWELKLRQGVRFHNGEPFTAQDVAYTFQAATSDPKSRLSVPKSQIAGVEVVDDYTVRLRTKTVLPAFLDNMANVRIVPASVGRAQGTDALNQSPIGTGPYRFREWVKDDHLTLERFADYWGEPPAIREIAFKPIPDAATRVAALETGQSDLVTALPPLDAQRLAGSRDLAIKRVPSMRTIYIGMNTGTGKAEAVDAPLRDLRVRRAVQHAIDYDAIIRDILKGEGKRVAGTLVPENAGFDPNLKGIEYDPERAKQLLAEAGYPDGITVDFDVPHGRYLLDREVGEAVAGQLAQVGIRTNLLVQEWGAYYDKYLGLRAKGLFLLGVGKEFEPDRHLITYYHSAGRGFYFRDADVDAAIDRLATLDVAARLQAIADAQRVILEKAHWAYLYQQLDIYGVRNRLRFEPSADEFPWLDRAQVVR